MYHAQGVAGDFVRAMLLDYNQRSVHTISRLCVLYKCVGMELNVDYNARGKAVVAGL